ncbi:hypothetical protein KPL74_05965 [Bacillus sp. NP157]|nr:hypothetical protein KPL74_05965 [Bacillus sp. NP157]
MLVIAGLWGIIAGAVVTRLLALLLGKTSRGRWSAFALSSLIGILCAGYFVTSTPGDVPALKLWILAMLDGSPATAFIVAWILAALAVTVTLTARSRR